MDSLLDTCVIIAYFDEKDKFYALAKKFISSNKDFIISVYQEKREFPFFFFRKEKIICEAIKFSAYSSYIPDTKKLTHKDEINLKKIIARVKISDLSQSELLIWQKEIYLLKQKVNYFLKSSVYRRIIPLDKIDQSLASLLNKSIKNTADCYILTSAIQENKHNKLIIITADKKDWDKQQIYEIVKQTSYKDIPEIRYLQGS